MFNVYIRKTNGQEARFSSVTKIEESNGAVIVQSGSKSKPVNFRPGTVRELVLHGFKESAPTPA